MSRIIPNNQITLLQNGEAHFPAIEAALDRAVHEIYLESYIFENDNTGRRIGEALRRAALRGSIESQWTCDAGKNDGPREQSDGGTETWLSARKRSCL